MSFSFATVDVKDELVKVFKEELPKFGFSKVKVVKADPQNEAEIPCIGINRVDDSESGSSIGDAAGDYFDREAGVHYRTYGSYFQESVEVRVWHTNADERDKLYQHVRAILFAARQTLVAKGLINLTLRGGRDEQDSSMAQASLVIYWAPITMSYQNPLDVTFEEVTGAITSIGAPAKGV